jgi:nucleoside phosphorylase
MKDAQEYKGRIDFGILMARQDELEAALDNRFEILDNARGLRTHVITRVATRDGGEYLLSLTRCSDQGHGPAYEVADAIITDLDPQWLIVVGIGGAVPADEFSLGDVLVANVVPDFSLQAANEGKPPTFDLRGGEVHPKVLDLVAHLPTMRNALAGWNTKQSIRVPLPRLDLPRLNSDALYGPEDWQKKVVASLTRNFPPTRKQPRPRRYWTGPIGTSNTLVKDTEFVNALLAGARGAVAVEMETGGARRAARRTDRDYPVLTIRGVSDVIGFKRNPDWTSFACHSAASFLYALIKARPIEPRSQSQSAKPSGSGAPGALKHDGSDSSPKQPGHYWGTAPSSVTLHGRDLEFRTLAEHCRRKSCRIIGLFGKGGIGKTALATAVIRAVADDFDFLYWHDLRNAPPIEEVLRHCLYVLSNFQSKTQPADTENLILDLIAHMRQHRTLLVLDNFETMMEPGKPSYRPGYAEYGSFIRKLGETDHSGCVVLTSREKPPEWTLIEDNNHTVVGHLVRRLDNSAGAKLLKQRPLVGPNSLLHAVVRLYSGNPAALKHVSEQIQTVYLGDVNAFLKSGQRLPTSVNAILCEQVSRLSSVEREILNWLAIAREAMTVDSLHDDLLTQESKESLANGLSILLDRDLVLRSEVGFTLENLVLEYLTDRLVEEFSADIISGSSITLLNSHAMLVASSKEHVRASQSRLLLRPVSDRVVSNHGGNSEAARYLWALLARLRVERGRRPGYATGNLINLLCELGADFTGSDLSELTIWQAYLREVALKNVSFRNAEFAKCAFVETFSGILSVAVSSDGTLLATGDAHGEVLVGAALLQLRLRHNLSIR